MKLPLSSVGILGAQKRQGEAQLSVCTPVYDGITAWPGATSQLNPIKTACEDNAEITFDVSLAYRDDMVTEWTEMAHAVQTRKLKCSFASSKTRAHEGQHYDGDALPFMEIGTVAHLLYLINIRLPVNESQGVNVGIGEIKDVRLIVCVSFLSLAFSKLYQISSPLPQVDWDNQIYFIFILHVVQYPRTCHCATCDFSVIILFVSNNNKKNLRVLCSVQFLHVVDQNDQTWLSGYWKWVGPIAVGSFCLFIFDIYKRGVQLKNPFYGFWTTDVGMQLALMAFFTIAGICLCLYYLFLCFLVFKVFQNFHGKPLSLPPIKKTCRIQNQELNIGFKFLMVITLICAAMTIIIFIVRQVSVLEVISDEKWGETSVQLKPPGWPGQ
ncbi:ribonuclease-like [Platysternon megacephalum]|uniref:Ribonuclease-like n=1 Tax=Platysternon megacephalum TaxID=55544 RepID=A0A4D9DUQ9_9SAUR|nr:ribonuclease-like [Platysternon megacephalum]